MMNYERFVLDNGLRILVHEDHSTPMAVVNVMYDVGSRDEDPHRTGFAHLFEHLMFGGSINIPEYDAPLQLAGGENNAYTSSDVTNYYIQLPAENLETAFWLESDRMLSLAFRKKSLEVQKKVVSEEFKEHYLNKPYGDVWFKIREMAYEVHPYKWLTIGKELSHIEQAELENVKEFFFKFYRPVNAVLVVAGHVKSDDVVRLAEKWFGDIPSGDKYYRKLPIEPKQLTPRRKEVESKVPLDGFYKNWNIYSRLDPRYYATDLITEVLGGGGSSRLYQTLVKEKKLFSNIECYHFGTVDPGLLTIEGKLIKGVAMKEAEDAIEEELRKLKDAGIDEKELVKVKNRTEAVITFEDMNLMNRAGSLAFYEVLGDASLMNLELQRYQDVTAESILQESRIIFDENNSSTLHYYAKN
jgi:zinc protease